MTYMALTGLTIMWAVVLLPSWIRDLRRSGGRGRSSIKTFQHQRQLLGAGAAPGTASRAPVRYDRRVAGSTVALAAPGVSVASRRRRDVLIWFTSMALVTLALWFVTRAGLALALHVLADAALVCYLALLSRVTRVRRGQAAKVRYMPARTVPALEPAWLPRTGS